MSESVGKHADRSNKPEFKYVKSRNLESQDNKDDNGGGGRRAGLIVAFLVVLGCVACVGGAWFYRFESGISSASGALAKDQNDADLEDIDLRVEEPAEPSNHDADAQTKNQEEEKIDQADNIDKDEENQKGKSDKKAIKKQVKNTKKLRKEEEKASKTQHQRNEKRQQKREEKKEKEEKKTSDKPRMEIQAEQYQSKPSPEQIKQ